MPNGFSKEVQQKLKYYVYVLVDPRNYSVFYVGQGCKNRVFEHEEKVLLETIIDLKQVNERPLKYIVSAGLTKEQALIVENALINTYLHHDMPLENVISGYKNIVSYEKVEHVQNRLLKPSLKKRDLEVYPGRKMLIQLPTESTRILSDADEVKRLTLKHARISHDIVQKPEIILATTKGVIVQVYKSVEWELVEVESSVRAGDKYRYWQCKDLTPDGNLTDILKCRKVDLRFGFCLRDGSKLYFDKNGE